MNWRRHARFLVALAAGSTLSVLPGPLAAPSRILGATDLFFVVYLVLMLLHARHLTAPELQRHAREDDEGVFAIVTLAVAGVLVSLGAIAGVLGGWLDADRLAAVLAVASVPLGWASVHTTMAFHYARLFYSEAGPQPALEFPGATAPAAWDFLYFSLTLGMTAQTADVGIASPRLRRTALGHAVLAFFYNTVIVALAVNAAVTLGQ